MTGPIMSGWIKPTTILFACEIPVNQRALAYATAQARHLRARLILFHVYDLLVVAAADAPSMRYFDYTAAAHAELHLLEPLAQHVGSAGVECEVVVEPGLPSEELLGYVRSHAVDRVIIGTHAPSSLARFVVGSVAEQLLRHSPVPLCVVGPHVPDLPARILEPKTILCPLSLSPECEHVALFAAQIAVAQGARLILQHILTPDWRRHSERRSPIHMEDDMRRLVPAELAAQLNIESIVVPGDPTEEILYQAHAQQTGLIVVGAHAASAVAAFGRAGVASRLIAQAECPVMILSPEILAPKSPEDLFHEALHVGVA